MESSAVKPAELFCIILRDEGSPNGKRGSLLKTDTYSEEKFLPIILIFTLRCGILNMPNNSYYPNGGVRVFYFNSIVTIYSCTNCRIWQKCKFRLYLYSKPYNVRIVWRQSEFAFFVRWLRLAHFFIIRRTADAKGKRQCRRNCRRTDQSVRKCRDLRPRHCDGVSFFPKERNSEIGKGAFVRSIHRRDQKETRKEIIGDTYHDDR